MVAIIWPAENDRQLQPYRVIWSIDGRAIPKTSYGENSLDPTELGNANSCSVMMVGP